MTHRHFVYNRTKRRGDVTEHPVEQEHTYLYGAWPDDTDFHPRNGTPTDYCRVPETDDDLLLLLKRSVKRVQERKAARRG